MIQFIYIVIIAITVIDFVFEKFLDFLNDRAKSPEMPPEAEGIYDAERYAKWLAYDKANSRVGVISSSISILLSLAMLIFGGFGWLDIQMRQITEQPVLLALLYFAVIGIASSIISLPFSLYSTFVIEEKFGFNKTTLKTLLWIC